VNEHLKRVEQVLNLIQPQATDLALAHRFGSRNDGGYVLINDLTNSDFLISMGIANDVNFEIDLSRLISACHLYDDSIERLPMYVENSVFFKERIGGYGNTSIVDTINKVDPKLDLLLKIDIEGSEWEALDNLEPKELDKFRQIVVEYHWLEKLLNDADYPKIVAVLEKMNRSHFVLNAHPNNNGDVFHIENMLLPSVIEVSYLRKTDYQVIYNPTNLVKILEPLNSPCNSEYPEVYLFGSKIPTNVNLLSKPLGSYSRFQSDALVRERDALVRERDALVRERDALVSERDALVSERDALVRERDALVSERDALVRERDALVRERDALVKSRIWKISEPYRRLRSLIASRLS
jgi:hypothetical protein